MITIQINGKTNETSAATLGELAAELNLPTQGVAMAVDNKMIQRSDWTSTPLAEGMKVIVIKAACGG